MAGFPNYGGPTAAASVRPPYIAGKWYPMAPGTMTVGGTGAATIQLTKFALPLGLTISDLGAQISTLDAAGNCQLGIYASDSATGLPTGSALAATGNISTAATGSVSADITGPNVTLAAGFYWAAVNHSAASVAIVAGTIFPMSSYNQGSTTLSNIVGATVGTTGYKLTIAQTFGTWPDLTGASFTEVNTTGPFLFLKAA